MNAFKGLSHLNPISYDDWLPWSLHERLRIGPAVPILGHHPMRAMPSTAWHLKPIGQHLHSRQFRIKKSICDRNLKELSLALKDARLLNSPITVFEGLTPLALACKLNQEEIVRYLILRGADVNARDSSGLTPLMHAVNNAHFDCIKILAESGARIEEKDNAGINSVEKAKIRNYRAIELFLREASEKKSTVNLPRFAVKIGFVRRTDKTVAFLDSLKFAKYDKPKVYPFNNLKGTYLISLTTLERTFKEE